MGRNFAGMAVRAHQTAQKRLEHNFAAIWAVPCVRRPRNPDLSPFPVAVFVADVFRRFAPKLMTLSEPPAHFHPRDGSFWPDPVGADGERREFHVARTNGWRGV